MNVSYLELRRRRKALMLALVQTARELDKGECHILIHENVANKTVKIAEATLGRKCEGDDDNQFYAAEQDAADRAWNDIVTLIENNARE